MADVDNEKVITVIKDNIGNSPEVKYFLEETIENKICEMLESLGDRKDFQQSIQGAVILCVNNAMNLIMKKMPQPVAASTGAKNSNGGNRKTRKLRRI